LSRRLGREGDAALGIDRLGHRHRVLARRQAAIDAALDEDFDDAARLKAEVERRDDMAPQMVQSLHRAERRQRRDHPVGERQARPVPHRAERQFGSQIGIIRHEMRHCAGPEQAAAQRRPITAQFFAGGHPRVSTRRLTGDAWLA